MTVEARNTLLLEIKDADSLKKKASVIKSNLHK